MNIGYARVSTSDQNLAAQSDALRAAGVKKEDTYTDKISGTKTARPGLDACLARLQEGDTLVVLKLDRLGRSLKHLIELSEELRERGVGLKVIDQGIDTTTNGGRLFFHMIGAFAEFERGLIQERTLEGLAAARARGNVGGHPHALTPAQRRIALELRADGKSYAEIASHFNTSKTTIVRLVQKAGE